VTEPDDGPRGPEPAEGAAEAPPALAAEIESASALARETPPAAPPARPRGGLRGELLRLLVPLVPGAIIVVATYLAYMQAADRQGYCVSQLSDAEAATACERIDRELDARARAIERLAAARAADTSAWRPGAGALLDGPLLFQAIARYDSAYAVVEVVPGAARALSTLGPGDDDARTAALRVARGSSAAEHGDAVVVSTVPLASGDRQLLVCVPDKGAGWIVGVLRVRDVLDAGLEVTLRRGYGAAVRELQLRIHGGDVGNAGAGAEYARDETVVHLPVVWTVQVWPAEDLVHDLVSQAPVELFVAGMLVAFGVTVATYLWMESRRR